MSDNISTSITERLTEALSRFATWVREPEPLEQSCGLSFDASDLCDFDEPADEEDSLADKDCDEDVMRRRERWRNYWQTGGTLEPSREVTALIIGGVPSEERAKVWSICAGLPSRMRREGSGYYEGLLASAEGTTTSATKQIEKDLHRTFCGMPGVQVPQDEAITSLRNVLVAYSVHNPCIGYCQSMNFITALLLLTFDEEEAFWMLVVVVEDVLPGYFSNTMMMSVVDQYVLKEMVSQQLPQLASHLECMQVALQLVTTPWFLCCFVGCLPLETVMRVWDCMFYLRAEGVKLLFQASYALLRINEVKLLRCRSMEDVYNNLMCLGTACCHPDILMQTAFQDIACRACTHLPAMRQQQYSLLCKQMLPGAVEGDAIVEAVICHNESSDVERQRGSSNDDGKMIIGSWTEIPKPEDDPLMLSTPPARSPLAAEGDWSLLELYPHRRLSYIILQLEAPELIENYFFKMNGKLLPREGGTLSRVVGRLDALTSVQENYWEVLPPIPCSSDMESSGSNLNRNGDEHFSICAQ